jgi:hypothetical protein
MQNAASSDDEAGSLYFKTTFHSDVRVSLFDKLLETPCSKYVLAPLLPSLSLHQEVKAC